MRLFLAALMALVPVLAADGQCRTIHHAPIVHHAAPVVVKDVVVQKELLVAQFVPLVVQVPTYSVTYAPGYAPQALYPPAAPVAQAAQPCPPGQGHQVAALEQRLTRIVELLEKGLGAGSPSPQPGNMPDHAKLFLAKCSACHDAGIAAAKGGGFVMSNAGQLTQFDAKAALKIASQAYKGAMPKGGPKLTDEEVGVVMAWADTVK